MAMKIVEQTGGITMFSNDDIYKILQSKESELYDLFIDSIYSSFYVDYIIIFFIDKYSGSIVTIQSRKGRDTLDDSQFIELFRIEPRLKETCGYFETVSESEVVEVTREFVEEREKDTFKYYFNRILKRIKLYGDSLGPIMI